MVLSQNTAIYQQNHPRLFLHSVKEAAQPPRCGERVARDVLGIAVAPRLLAPALPDGVLC